MTEAEYRLLNEFRGLPLYYEADPRCNDIASPDRETAVGTVIREVHKAHELKTALAYLKRDNFVPKGGIRYRADSVAACFWEVWSW
jgi:hypothetical protein